MYFMDIAKEINNNNTKYLSLSMFYREQIVSGEKKRNSLVNLHEGHEQNW